MTCWSQGYGPHVTALSHDFIAAAASVLLMGTRASLLAGRRSADETTRQRSWMDHVLLVAVILLALVALRYMHGVSGPTTWIE